MSDAANGLFKKGQDGACDREVALHGRGRAALGLYFPHQGGCVIHPPPVMYSDCIARVR
jgi:hypothetical protein